MEIHSPKPDCEKLHNSNTSVSSTGSLENKKREMEIEAYKLKMSSETDQSIVIHGFYLNPDSNKSAFYSGMTQLFQNLYIYLSFTNPCEVAAIILNLEMRKLKLRGVH